MLYTSQSVWRKREFGFVPNASLTLQSKSWKKQCRNGGDTCENACAWQTKGCAKGAETCGLLTNDPALSPLFPFCMFYTARSTEDQRLSGQTWKVLWCWKVSYKCSDLTTGIFVPKIKLLLQNRFTDSSSSCKFCHLFHLWISKHTGMER